MSCSRSDMFGTSERVEEKWLDNHEVPVRRGGLEDSPREGREGRGGRGGRGGQQQGEGWDLEFSLGRFIAQTCHHCPEIRNVDKPGGSTG
eukprot:767023-Hanusia_phi.AAC.5